MSIDDVTFYGGGFCFYKLDGECIYTPPENDIDAIYAGEWMLGYLAAMADNYLGEEEPESVETSLYERGIDKNTADRLIKAAEKAINTSKKWLRLPNTPMRETKDK